jgi:hypothetical protein
MAKKYYAQKDALGFPIPGTMMSAFQLPKASNIIEISLDHNVTYFTKPHPKGLRYFVNVDKKGKIIPNSLVVSLKKPSAQAYELKVNRAVATDTIPHAFPLAYPSVRVYCNGNTAVTKYTSVNTVASMTDLVNLFNSDPDMSQLGMYSAVDETTLRLTMGANEVAQYCPSGNITINLFED